MYKCCTDIYRENVPGKTNEKKNRLTFSVPGRARAGGLRKMKFMKDLRAHEIVSFVYVYF